MLSASNASNELMTIIFWFLFKIATPLLTLLEKPEISKLCCLHWVKLLIFRFKNILDSQKYLMIHLQNTSVLFCSDFLQVDYRWHSHLSIALHQDTKKWLIKIFCSPKIFNELMNNSAMTSVVSNHRSMNVPHLKYLVELSRSIGFIHQRSQWNGSRH